MVSVLFYFFSFVSLSLEICKGNWCKLEVKSGIRWKTFEAPPCYAYLVCNYERDRVGLGIL